MEYSLGVSAVNREESLWCHPLQWGGFKLMLVKPLDTQLGCPKLSLGISSPSYRPLGMRAIWLEFLLFQPLECLLLYLFLLKITAQPIVLRG